MTLGLQEVRRMDERGTRAEIGSQGELKGRSGDRNTRRAGSGERRGERRTENREESGEESGKESGNAGVYCDTPSKQHEKVL